MYSPLLCYSYCPLWLTSEDEGKALRPRMVYVAINSDVVDNKCYIPTGMKNTCYLSYLTLDTTS